MLQARSQLLLRESGALSRSARFTPRSHLPRSLSSLISNSSCDAILIKSTNIGRSRRQPVAEFTARSSRIVAVKGQARETLSLPTDRDLDTPLDGFDSIHDALIDMAAGKFLVVLDDENRENEGDLIIASDRVTTEAMAFMVEHTSGVICIGMEGKDLDRLRLPLMVRSAENDESMYTAFTITVDLRDGITTGISAADRSATLRYLSNPKAGPEEFRRPGHIFPLRYHPGGVIIRPGHTEASVDLARLAGCFPAGALCEMVNKADGSMSRTPELLAFAKQHGLRCITIADLIRYRLRHEQLVKPSGAAMLNTRNGLLTVHTFVSEIDGAEHVAIVAGDVANRKDVLVHVQRDSSVADLIGCVPVASATGDGCVLAEDMLGLIAASGHGVLVYMRSQASSGKGPTLAAELQQLSAAQGAAGGKCAPPQAPATMDLVDYALAVQMLATLQVKSAVLASADRVHHRALESCGLLINGIAPAHDQINGRVINGQSTVLSAGVRS